MPDKTLPDKNPPVSFIGAGQKPSHEKTGPDKNPPMEKREQFDARCATINDH